jgi:hypothetical protein
MTDHTGPAPAPRGRQGRIRAAFAAGLTMFQVGVWYPILEGTAEEGPGLGRVWVEVDGTVWSVPEERLEFRSEDELPAPPRHPRARRRLA